MLNLNLLKTFVSVAESSSFTRAAGEMYRSQPAISMQIKRLEEVLQVELFKRAGKAVTLSSEGEVFLHYCHRILRLTDEAVSAVQRKATTTRMVRLGCIEDYAGRLLPSMLARFLATNYDIHIEVKIGETAMLVAGLGRNHDIVLASYPGGAGEGSLVRTDRMVWAQAPGAGLEHRSPLPIALRSGAVLDQRWAAAALDAAGRPWRCTYLPSGIGTLLGAVEDGLAIGVFKALTVPAKLETLGADHGFPSMPSLDICLHVASEMEDDRAVQALAQHLCEMLAAVEDDDERQPSPSGDRRGVQHPDDGRA